MAAIVTGRADRGQPLTWIEIGSAAGPAAPVPSAALRAARLQIAGSGQGSVSTRGILAELPALAREITKGTFDIGARPTPLADVEQAWADAARTTQRIVLTPQPQTPAMLWLIAVARTARGNGRKKHRQSSEPIRSLVS